VLVVGAGIATLAAAAGLLIGMDTVLTVGAVLAAAEERRHALLTADSARLREQKVAGWARWRASRRDQV